jgi:hypothetical protein
VARSVQANRGLAPVATIVNVLIETGDAGPVSPAAYNLPNYNDIRNRYGSKNVILNNIENTRAQGIELTVVKEFFLPEYRDPMLALMHTVIRPLHVYLHEIIGHGSGRPDPALRADPRASLGRTYSALEEARADLVGLYTIGDPKMVELGAYEPTMRQVIMETSYAGYLQGWMSRMDRVEGHDVREAHDRGHHAILMWLVRGGEKGRNYGVEVKQIEGDFFVRIPRHRARARGCRRPAGATAGDQVHRRCGRGPAHLRRVRHPAGSRMEGEHLRAPRTAPSPQDESVRVPTPEAGRTQWRDRRCDGRLRRRSHRAAAALPPPRALARDHRRLDAPVVQGYNHFAPHPRRCEMRSLTWLTVIGGLAVSLSCGQSNPTDPVDQNLSRLANFATGRIVVSVHWQEEGLSGKRVDILELDRTRYTRQDGTATFHVPTGTFTVRVYEINRGGPALPWVDTNVTVTAGEEALVDVVDCLPCV